MSNIDNEISYYKTNRKNFMTEYAGKHIVIKNMAVIGAYDSHTDALNETMKTHEKGSFIIERPIDLTLKTNSPSILVKR